MTLTAECDCRVMISAVNDAAYRLVEVIFRCLYCLQI